MLLVTVDIKGFLQMFKTSFSALIELNGTYIEIDPRVFTVSSFTFHKTIISFGH